TGNIWRAVGRRARLDLKHFRRFVTMNNEATGSWRGEISDGEVVSEPEDDEEQTEPTDEDEAPETEEEAPEDEDEDEDDEYDEEEGEEAEEPERQKEPA